MGNKMRVVRVRVPGMSGAGVWVDRGGDPGVFCLWVDGGAAPQQQEE